MFEEAGSFIIESTGETIYIAKTKGGVSVMPLSDYRWAYGQHHPEKWSEKNNGKKVA